LLPPLFPTSPPPTPLHTLPLHDALPICHVRQRPHGHLRLAPAIAERPHPHAQPAPGLALVAADPDLLLQPPALARRRRRSGSARSEEHTSALPSLTNLVCRLLLETQTTP